jgi:hypothetical protein
MTNSKKSDLEGQAKDEKRGNLGSPTPSIDSEYHVPAARKFAFLGVYFLCNVSLTIYNKAVLGKVFSSLLPRISNPFPPTSDGADRHRTDKRQFAYPWLLTTLHAGSASIGCYILLVRGAFSLTRLSYQENVILVLFSFLFTINIAVSNVSLYVVGFLFFHPFFHHLTSRSSLPSPRYLSPRSRVWSFIFPIGDVSARLTLLI